MYNMPTPKIYLSKTGKRYFKLHGKRIYIKTGLTYAQVKAVYKRLKKLKRKKRPAPKGARATAKVINNITGPADANRSGEEKELLMNALENLKSARADMAQNNTHTRVLQDFFDRHGRPANAVEVEAEGAEEDAHDARNAEEEEQRRLEDADIERQRQEQQDEFDQASASLNRIPPPHIFPRAQIPSFSSTPPSPASLLFFGTSASLPTSSLSPNTIRFAPSPAKRLEVGRKGQAVLQVVQQKRAQEDDLSRVIEEMQGMEDEDVEKLLSAQQPSAQQVIDYRKTFGEEPRPRTSLRKTLEDVRSRSEVIPPIASSSSSTSILFKSPMPSSPIKFGPQPAPSSPITFGPQPAPLPKPALAPAPAKKTPEEERATFMQRKARAKELHTKAHADAIDAANRQDVIDTAGVGTRHAKLTATYKARNYLPKLRTLSVPELEKTFRERSHAEARARIKSLEDFEFDLQSASGKSKHSNGLYNDEIEKIMQMYPEFVGCISRDEIKQILPQVEHGKKICWIMNTQNHDQAGEHWFAIYIDPVGSKSIEYFDSFGREIPPDIQKDVKLVIDIMKPNTFLKLKSNHVIHQFDSSNTCGYHAALFLLDRLRGKSFSEATGYDEVMHKPNQAPKYEAQIERLKKMAPFNYIN